ncbi:MAG: ABC transporter permease, partial [Negativicutes bacterium]|nr:ABC transporter permease [Negativicutes bacterium]
MDQSRSQWRQFWRKLSKRKISLVGGAIILAYILIAILAPWLAPHDPLHIQLDKSLIGPVENWNMNGNFWFGTDDKGRDILSRILYGARLSLLVGVVAVGIG